MDSDYKREEMDPMKNSPPPPWFEDQMRKSNKSAIRDTYILQEILDRLTENEERTKSLENTITKQNDKIERLIIQV